VGKNQDPDPDFLTILDPGSGFATLNIILKIFSRVKRQMEEELKMALEVYITEAQANLQDRSTGTSKALLLASYGTAAAHHVGVVADFDSCRILA
jgi:hypothetical protein